jgi:hypothetical protein
VTSSEVEDTDPSKGETRATVVHAKSGGDYQHLATLQQTPELASASNLHTRHFQPFGNAHITSRGMEGNL